MMIESYPFQIFPQPYVDPVRFSCQMCTNPTFFQRKALSQSQQHPPQKRYFTVYAFDCLHYISVALATPSANSNKVRAAFFIIPLDSYLAQIRSKCSVRLKSKCLQFLRNGANGSFLFFVSWFAFFFFFFFLLVFFFFFFFFFSIWQCCLNLF